MTDFRCYTDGFALWIYRGDAEIGVCAFESGEALKAHTPQSYWGQENSIGAQLPAVPHQLFYVCEQYDELIK